jgi:hypothetical protein
MREELGESPALHRMEPQKPLPLRFLLTRPVLISVANYAMLALLGMVSMALIPLIWPTSIEFGGLGLSPASIGLWLSVYGCMNGVFQFAVFPRAVGRFGPRLIFVTGIGVFVVVYAMFPLENWALRRAADNPAWVLILVQLTGLSISEMGYSRSLPFLLGTDLTLILLGPSRLRIHVSKFRRPEQAVTRRNKRFRAVGGVGPAHHRASGCRLAFRILHHE